MPIGPTHSIYATCEMNRCIAIATSRVVRSSISYFGFTSLNSTIFVLANDAAYFTKVMNSPARRPSGEGADVPGASAHLTESRSNPKNVLSEELCPINR